MTKPNRPVVRGLLGVVLGVVALSAFAGGVYGFAGAPEVPRALLDGSPFHDYLVPSVILFFAVGGSMAIAAVLVLARRRHSREAATGAGAILVGWIAVQVIVIGWISWLQPACAVIGVAIIALASALSRTQDEVLRSPPVRSVP